MNASVPTERVFSTILLMEILKILEEQLLIKYQNLNWNSSVQTGKPTRNYKLIQLSSLFISLAVSNPLD